MKTDYVRRLVDAVCTGAGVVYPVLHGVNVSTVFVTKIQAMLAEQPQGQFLVTGGNGDINVRLNEEVKTVCQECGSPLFWTRIIEDHDSYIDPCHGKAKITMLIERTTQVRCQLCGTLKDVKAHRHPEIKP